MRLPRASVGVNAASLWGCVALLVFASGCNSEPVRIPIRGQVSLDGKPLEEGVIVFYPIGQDVRPAQTTVQQGAFELAAQPGEYKVTVAAFQHFTPDILPGEPGYKEPKALIPMKYSSLTKTVLRFTVNEQSNLCDFDLAMR